MQKIIPFIILLILLIITTVVLFIFYKKKKSIIVSKYLQSGLIAILVTGVNIFATLVFSPSFLISIILYSSFLLVSLPLFEYFKKKDLLFLLQKILFILIFVVTFIEMQFGIEHKIIDMILGFVIGALILVTVATLKENIESIKERMKNPPWK